MVPGRPKRLAFVIHGTPEIVGFSVDPDEHLVQVPPPLRQIPVRRNALLPDLGCEHRSEQIPPSPDGFMADVDPAFVKKTFDLPQRQRDADINHHRQVENLGRRLEITERISLQQRLWQAHHQPKLVSPDIALGRLPWQNLPRLLLKK
jgi:hypothetical protein